MKLTGLAILIVGIIWAAIAINMNTTVEAGGQTLGSGEFSVQVPRVTVQNLGLMEARRNQLMFAGLGVLVGVLLLGFGTLSQANAPIVRSEEPCPKCGGMNTAGDAECRYCTAPIAQPLSSTGLETSEVHPRSGDLADQIERLAALKQHGLLSEAEFEIAKAKLLAVS